MRPVPALEGIAPYRVPGRRCPVDVRLDGNEGATPPAELFAVLGERGSDVMRRYPDASALEALLAARHGVAAEQVMVTAGGDEALDRAFRALLCPGRELIMPVPTFEMIERYAHLSGAEAVAVPWPEGPFPREAVLERVTPRTAAIAVVSPNNPTGAVATPEDVAALCEAAPDAAILVDAAYEEFAERPLTPEALRHPNAILFKTVSKAWGLAGLRVGYAVASPEVIHWMRCAGGPYSVAGPSLALAAACLERGEDDLRAFVQRIREERAQLADLLRDLGADPLPSQANFLLARFADWRWAWEGLAGLGIAVRAFPGRPHLDGCLRITCPGRDDWLDRLTRGLRAVLAPQAVLFDLDGVLADVSASYREAIIQTAAHFGARVTAGDVAALKARGGANNDWDVTRRLLAARGRDVSLAEVTERFERLYQGTAASPGLRATERLLLERAALERLARRLPLAVVTGRPRSDAERFLADAGIADVFSASVCMEDAPLKPDPAPVRLALRRLGVERAWMVGDTPDDVRAARAAGVVPVGVVAPGEDPDAGAATLTEAGAGRVLQSLDELEGMLG